MKTICLSRATGILGSLLLLFTTSGWSAETQVLHNHVPAAVKSLQSLERFPGTNRLSLAIGLPLRNQATLSNLLRQIYDPASPNYHHYLTPEQFAKQFGPTEADYQKVAAFANSNGLRVATMHPNRLLLDVSGSVADVERALHVTMQTYRHPTENRTFYAPDTEPSLDLAVPIVHISGLNNYSLPRPRLVINPQTGGWNASPNSGSGPTGGYMGKDFRSAYVPDTTLNGSGQVVGLLQFDGYSASDITYYENLAGLPNVPLQNVLIDGASGLPSGSGGEVEVSLDIEMAISMATNLSKVIVYEAANPSPFVDLLNRMATDNLAKQLSCSWYVPNGTAEPAADLIFQQMAAQGQSFFSASGDYDAFTGLIPFPGDTPYITEVGGTTLSTTGPGGSWVSETVWNRGNGIGSGGGISTQYPIPGWQTNVSMAANQGSTTMRNIPDVALTAENVYVRADGVDQTVGGTSCAAPLWAGFAALINQQAAATGKPAIGFINPAVYAIGAAANYASVFHDTTAGNNTSSSSPTKFYAATGYDLCTGWGTPAGQKLIDAFAPPIIITLPASATEGDGLLAGAGRIQLPAFATSNVVVGLGSSDPAQVSVPASVTVLTGQSNAVFNLTILDDGVLDGTQTATVTASVPGSGTSSASMTIFDKETATLQVLLQTTATKGQGAVQGTVQVSAPVAADVTVALSSSSTNLIQVPASVIIPSGQSSAAFTATILTDGQINGGQTVNITAHVQNWTDGTAAVTVRDNMNLAVTLPASAWENAGVLVNAGSVRISGTSSSSVMVSLASGNPAKLAVPSSVTIPAGQVSNTFNLTLVDNSIADGHQPVTVTASAPGFTNGSASMLILDDESPPIPSNPRPGNLATNVPANTNLMWDNGTANELVLNGGFEDGTLGNWTLTTNSYNGHFLINNGTVDPPSPDGPLPPFDGNFSALGTESGGGIFYMYQDISIPSSATSATLSWAHRVRNFYSSFSSIQQFQVRICDINNNVLATPFTTNPGDPLLGNWVQNSYDLTSFAGKTVRVMFWVNPGGYYLDVHVDSVSVKVNSPGTASSGVITNDVYFGTNPAPGPAEFQGSTTNTPWTLPLLAPLTTYYWQIVAHRTGSATGAVWQFTTAGVDHFAWNTISSPQYMSQPFGVAVTAKDAFNSTVSNFTGTVLLQATAGGGYSTIEDFESGIWPQTPWVSVNGSTFGTISSAYAHDGNYGVSDPEWFYRTDFSLGNAGNSLSWWVRPSSSSAGRAYLGFGASAGGCWSVVAEPNTSQFAIKQDSAYGFVDVVTANQTWQAGKWYRLEVQFASTTSVICNLYDSDGTTLLNTLSYNNVTGLPGGVAIRSFGGFSLDTIKSGAPATIAISPTNSGIFINGVWSGNVAVLNRATNVMLMADDGSGHAGLSNPFDVSLTNTAPFILVQPTNQTVSVGGAATFTVVADGTAPLIYQWSFNGINIVGATNASLTLLNVQLNNAGSYSVRVSNLFGSVTSSNAVLTVLALPPTITMQPSNQTVIVGGTASFSVTAIGSTPLSYQWSLNGTNIAGATNSSLLLSNVQFGQAGNYAARLVNQFGSTNSSNATLTVLAAPPCDPAPSGLVAMWEAEGNANDSIGTNNGTLLGGLSFALGEVGQAFLLNTTNAGVKIQASPSLNVGAGGGFTIEGWINPSGPFLGQANTIAEWNTGGTYGANFAINVTYPGNLYANIVDSGGSAHLIYTTSAVVATNVFQHVALTYNKASGVATLYCNGAVVLQQTLGSFTPQTTYDLYLGQSPRAAGPVDLTGLMDEVSVYNRALSSSEIAAIYNAGSSGKCPVPPTILVQPTNQAVNIGGTATFAVQAVGTQPLNYQWSFNGTNISGATNTSLTLTNVQSIQAGTYVVQVANVAGSTNSASAMLTVLAGPSCDPPPSGLVAWWPGEGNANDSAGTNNASVVSGIGYTNGEVGQAFQYDGSTSLITVPASPSLAVSNVTLEAWIFPSDLNAIRPIFDYGGAGQLSNIGLWLNTQDGLSINPGGLHALIRGQLITSPVLDVGTVNTPVKLNQWNHVAFTADLTTLTGVLYWNGVPVKTNTASGPVYPPSFEPVNLGYRDSGSLESLAGRRFKGRLDEASIYNRALSSSEIAAIYNAGSSGKCPVPPTILVQPTNQAVNVGGTATFSVRANGTQPLFYQWSLNGTNILSATNTSLTLTNVQPIQAGTYVVQVANVVGSTNSANAVLTVNLVSTCDPPPTGVVAWWQSEGNANDSIGTNNGTMVNGATFAAGEVGQAFGFNGVNSYFVASDTGLPSGNNPRTVECWMKWQAGAAGNNEPFLYGGLSGSDAFYVVVIGNRLYIGSWGGGDTPGSTTATDGNWHHIGLTHDGTTTRMYVDGQLDAQVNITHNTTRPGSLYIGAVPTSADRFKGQVDELAIYSRSLSIAEIQAIYDAGSAGKCPLPPIILAQPTNQTVSTGGTATFSVSANGTQPLFYQWSLNGTNIFGATNTTLTLSNVQSIQAGTYVVQVVNVAGSTNSANAVLTVTTPPVITTQPASRTNFVGTTATFAVVAGGSTPYNYQWKKNGTNLVGATGTNFTIVNVQTSDAGVYSVAITNAYGSIISSNATLTVLAGPSCDPPPSGLVAWWPGEGNANDSAGTNNASVVSGIGYTNGEVGQAFQYDGSTSLITVPASPSLAVSNVTLEAWIFPSDLNAIRPIFDYGGAGQLSNIGLWLNTQDGLSINPGGLHALIRGQLITSPVLDVGTVNTPVKLNQWNHVAFTADLTTLTGVLYWNGVPVKTNTASGPVYPPSFEPVNLGYRDSGSLESLAGRRFKGRLDEASIYNRALSSSEIAAIYNAGSSGKCPVPPTILVQPTNQAVNVGGTATFSVRANGTQPLFYQWSLNGTNILSATNTSLTLTNVQPIQAGTYVVQVANVVGSTNSANAVLTVTTPPVITAQPASCTNAAGTTASFGVAASGSPPLNYQWKKSGTNLVGQTGTNLIIVNVQITDAGVYSVAITNAAGSVTSSNAVLTVLSPPIITLQPSSCTNVAGTTATFTNLASGTLPLNYQWLKDGVNLTDGGNVSGSATNILTLTSVSNADVAGYSVIITNNFGSVTSSVANLTVVVIDPPVIITQPVSSTNVVGTTATFSVVAGGSMPLYYHWKKNGVFLANIGTNLTIVNVKTNDAASYSVQVYNSAGSVVSSNAVLTVLVPPSITLQPASRTNLAGTTATFTNLASGTLPLNYQWRKNGANLNDGGNVSGSATNILTLTSVSDADATNYKVVVTNVAGSITSSVANLVVLDPPAILSQPTNLTVIRSSTATFSVIASGSSVLSYQWNFNGTNISGATNTSLTLTNVQLGQAGNYAVLVTNNYGSVLSSNALLTVNPVSNNVPVITAFSPQSGAAGVVVNITGMNFDPIPGNNKVHFGAVQAVVSAASTTNLVVSVPVGATYKPITETVNGLTAYAPVPFLPTFLSGGVLTNTSLAAQLVLNGDASPDFVAIGDLDGDGKPDVVVHNGSSPSISIFQNISTNGSLTAGSFGPRIDLAIGGVTSSGGGLVLADLTGDGRLDIITSSSSANKVCVFQNFCTPGTIASNSFGGRVDISVNGVPEVFGVQDLDGDGKPEIVTVDAGSTTVSVLRNIGATGIITTNSFAPAVSFAGAAGAEGGAIADLDGDGKPDVVAVNEVNGNNNAISVFRNVSTLGNIAFASRIDFPGPIYSYKLAIGDMDGDGKLDVVFVSFATGQSVSVYRNTSTPGSIAFASRIDFGLGGWGNGVALGDMDGDGKPDVAATTQISSQLSLFRNVSTAGSFASSSLAARLDFASGSNPFGIAIGDLDGDGRPDVIFCNNYDNTLSICQNIVPLGGPPVITMQPASQTNYVGTPASFSVAATGSTPLNYQWKKNGTNLVGATGTNFTIVSVQISDAGVYSVAITNAYGSTNSSNAVLTVNPVPNNVPVITAFSPKTGAAGAVVNITGLNFDPAPGNNTVHFGAVQAVVSAASATNLTVSVPVGATYAPITETVNGLTAYAPVPFLPTFLSGGVLTNTSLAAQLVLNGDASPDFVAIGDLDGDGKPDVVVHNGSSPSISIFQNISTNGSLTAGSFGPRIDLAIGGVTSSGGGLVLADLTGDGRLDIITSSSSANKVCVFQNFCTPGTIASNSFGGRVDISVNGVPEVFGVQDLDGDGKPEIVTVDAGSTTVSVLRNIGATGIITTNSFAPAVSFAGAAGAEGGAIADLDGDGKPDVVAVNEVNGNNNAISVFRNVSTLGNIAFASRIDFPGPIYSYKLAIGDMDGDGKLDVVFVSFATGQSVSVYRNTSTPGSIAFASRIDFGLGGWGNGVALGDMDGDGKPDVAATTQISSQLSLFRNVSTAGSFASSSLAARLDFASGSNPFGIAIGDLDGDGRPDVVFCNNYDNTLSIYQNIVPARPFIILQPLSSTNILDTTATFSVIASGSPVLSYQWNFNGTNIAGATNTSLTLTNVRLNQAGAYAVWVTNSYGSIMSSNATLVVNPLLYFVWSQVPSPRFANTPFTVVIQAQNLTNGIVTSFTNTVVVLSTNGVPVSPAVSGNFIQGVWTGAVTVAQTATNLVLQATDNIGDSGLANPINIISLPSLRTLPSGGTLNIVWPVNPSGFVLETTASLSPANWVPVTALPTQNGDQYQLPIQMPGTNAFYRLRFIGQ